jgi:hypothetical protein
MLFKKGRKEKKASGTVPFSASISTAAAASNLSTPTSNFNFYGNRKKTVRGNL